MIGITSDSISQGRNLVVVLCSSHFFIGFWSHLTLPSSPILIDYCKFNTLKSTCTPNPSRSSASFSPYRSHHLQNHPFSFQSILHTYKMQILWHYTYGLKIFQWLSINDKVKAICLNLISSPLKYSFLKLPTSSQCYLTSCDSLKDMLFLLHYTIVFLVLLLLHFSS